MLSRYKRTAFSLVLVLAIFSLPLVFFAPTVKAAVLYDSGNPTPVEQLVLEYINRARADPVAEGQRLGIDIHEGLTDPSLVGPRPPLAMNKDLLAIAQAHSQDMYNLDYFSHNDPNGTTPFGRMINAGYDYVLAGENMGAGSSDLGATELEDLIMVDAGTSGRPHRVNLLDLIGPYPCGDPPCAYSEIGIGYYGQAGPNGIGLGSLLTEDFGATGNTGPFLLGVIYNDLNNNNFYDIGEGVPGVTITTNSGGYYAVSSSSGGYAIPAGASGTITVTATGPGFGPITKTVNLNGANVKLDFTPQSSTITTIQTSTTSSATSIYSFSTSTISQRSPSTTTSTSTYSSSTTTTATSTQNPLATSTSTFSTTISTPTTSVQVATLTSTTVTTYSTTQTSNPTTQLTSRTVNTMSSSGPSDFLLAAAPNPISMPQASSATMTLTLQSIGGFNNLVALNAANLPPGVQASFSPSTIVPPTGGTATIAVTLTVSRSVPTGTYTFNIWGADNAKAKQIPVTLQVSGCLIATATFGSELAPEVQFLRDFRDYKILQTFAGSSFMVAFNDWYYSFSPAVAQFEYNHPPARAGMEVVLYPLIEILRIGAAAYDILPINHEAGAVLSGLTISALLGTIYIGLPLTVILGKLPLLRRRTLRRCQRLSAYSLAGSLLLMTVAELFGMGVLMTLATSSVILSAIGTTALWTQRGATAAKHLLSSRVRNQ